MKYKTALVHYPKFCGFPDNW